MKKILSFIRYLFSPICTVGGEKVRCEICGRYMRLGYWDIGGLSWYACPKDGRVYGSYKKCF